MLYLYFRNVQKSIRINQIALLLFNNKGYKNRQYPLYISFVPTSYQGYIWNYEEKVHNIFVRGYIFSANKYSIISLCSLKPTREFLIILTKDLIHTLLLYHAQINFSFVIDNSLLFNHSGSTVQTRRRHFKRHIPSKVSDRFVLLK